MAMSDVFFTHRIAKQQHESKAWKLRPDHIADLRDVTRGVEESDAGIACKYLIDQFSGQGADYDEITLNALERFCDQHDVWKHPTVASFRTRIIRCRRALNKMRYAGQHKHASVLYIVFGYPDPAIRELPKRALDSLGELASLAKYADIVEVYRQEIAREEASELSSRLDNSSRTYDEQQTKALESVQRADAFRYGYRAQDAATMAPLIRNRERYEWAMRVTSSSDALRKMFRPTSDCSLNESREHFMKRKENDEIKRDVVLSQIKIDVTKMYEGACKAYHHAWLSSTA